MSLIRASFKMVFFCLTVVAYLLTALVFYPLTWISPFRVRKILVFIISFYARLGLSFMGVKVKLKGDLDNIKGSLIVCNHLGYLDVLVMASRLRAAFVTSLEMRQTPFLGQLCEMGGCLYVDRRSRANLSKEILMLTEALKTGLNVCIFPEGTSTDGSEVLRFRRPLFRASIDANVPLSVMCLNYQRLDDEMISTHNRDDLFWYGDMSFLPHLWRFFKRRSTLVELSFLTQIAGEEDHVELGLKAHELVSAHFRPVTLSSWPREEWQVPDLQARSGAQS